MDKEAGADFTDKFAKKLLMFGKKEEKFLEGNPDFLLEELEKAAVALEKQMEVRRKSVKSAKSDPDDPDQSVSRNPYAINWGICGLKSNNRFRILN